MNLFRMIGAMALTVSLSACATPYGQMSFLGGVDATPLGPDREMIVARGNGFTDSAKVQQFVLLKASEDCLAAGYDRFYIMSEKDATRHGSFTTPAYANSYSTVNGYGYGNNFSANVNTTTTMMPGQTYNFVKPGENVIVQFVRSSTAGTEQAFDARTIEASLGPRLRKK
jgi:hypothetical protein